MTSVSHIATQNEKGASLISARVRIDHPDENVFLGVDAKVTIQAASAHDVVILPEGSFCYVLENGTVARKNIETGISSDEYIEVISGLKEGDTVIRDIGGLQEGMAAEPMTSDSPEAMTGEDA